MTEDGESIEALEVEPKSQRFFAGLHAETLRPWFGDKERETIKALLIRAEEAGLYRSEKP